MFTPKKSKVIDETISTIIGEGIIIENALVTGNSAMKVDGSLSGTVNLESSFILSQSGKMKGDISVKNAVIAGEMSGNVTAEDSVHIASTGKLKGNIKSLNLIIDEGARFNGKSQMDSGNGNAYDNEKEIENETDDK